MQHNPKPIPRALNSELYKDPCINTESLKLRFPARRAGESGPVSSGVAGLLMKGSGVRWGESEDSATFQVVQTTAMTLAILCPYFR